MFNKDSSRTLFYISRVCVNKGGSEWFVCGGGSDIPLTEKNVT